MRDTSESDNGIPDCIGDEEFVSGKVGFQVGESPPNAVYVDDFRIAIPE